MLCNSVCFQSHLVCRGIHVTASCLHCLWANTKIVTMDQNKDANTQISELMRKAESCVQLEARCTGVASMSAHAAYVITWKERAYISYYPNSRNVRAGHWALTLTAVGGIGITLSQTGRWLHSVDVNKNRENVLMMWPNLCYEILLCWAELLHLGRCCNKNSMQTFAVELLLFCETQLQIWWLRIFQMNTC